MSMENTQIKDYPTPNDEMYVSRQDFGGGSGVFSIFFDELAEDDSFRKSDPQNFAHEIQQADHDLNNIYSSTDNSPIYSKDAQFFINESLEKNPLHNLYESREDQDQSSFFTDNRIDHNENQLFLNYSSRKKQPKILNSRYLLGSTFGRGSYGKVKDCLDLKTYRRLAVKIISKHAVRKIVGGWSQAINEAAIMLKLPPNRHIVRLIQPLYLKDPERIALVMEYCLGSIHDLQSSGVPPSCVVPEKSTNSTIERLKNRTSMMRIATEPVFDSVSTHENDSVFHHKEYQRSYPVNGHTSQFRRLTETQSHAYFLQILSGINYLHSQRVIHRDIKPGNLLLTTFPGCGLDSIGTESVENDSANTYGKTWTIEELLKMSRGYLVKITDFGVSTTLAPDNVKQLVPSGQMTLAIQPPEVAKGEVSEFNGPKLDIYSAGVSLYFMITGHVPFSTPNVLQMLDVIVNGTLIIPGHVSVNAANLINAMMLKDPNKRISLEDIWKHEWVINYPRSHPTKEKAMQHCKNYWKIHNPKEVDETCVVRWKLHGYPIWIEPLEYLCRPQTNFSLPHIDGTGSRIFSAEECEEYFSKSIEQQNKISHAAAPITTLSRFSTYLENYTEDGVRRQSEEQLPPDSFVNIPGKILIDNSDLMHQIEDESFEYRSIANAYDEPEDFSKKFSVFNLGQELNEEDDEEDICTPFTTRCRHHSSIVTDNFNFDAKPDDLPIEHNSDQQKTAMTLNSLTKNQFRLLIKRLENQNHANTPKDFAFEQMNNYDEPINSLPISVVNEHHSSQNIKNIGPNLDITGPKNRKISSWFKNKFKNPFVNSSNQTETLSLPETENPKKVKRKPTSLLSKVSFRRGNREKNS